MIFHPRSRKLVLKSCAIFRPIFLKLFMLEIIQQIKIIANKQLKIRVEICAVITSQAITSVIKLEPEQNEKQRKSKTSQDVTHVKFGFNAVQLPIFRKKEKFAS